MLVRHRCQKNADPDLPIYKEARAEYAALRKTAQ
jgi:hypothetical protein